MQLDPDRIVSMSQWPEPESLTQEAPRPAYPIDSMPGVVAEMVQAVATTTAVPIEMAAPVALGCLNGASVGAVQVRLGPSWLEPNPLYFCVVASPGEAKTPTVRHFRAPLELIEHEQRNVAAALLEQDKATRKILEQRRDELAAAMSTGSEGQTKELAAIVDQLESLRTSLPRLLAEEITPEALCHILASNNGRLAVVSHEGAEVWEMAGRYQSKGKAAFGIYLAGHDGSSHHVDRIGRDSVYIPRVTLSMTLCVQPVAAQEILSDRRARGRGLLARFLYSYPCSQVGFRPIDRPGIPDCIAGQWEATLRNAAEVSARLPEPMTLELDQAAKERFDSWREVHETRLRPGADLGEFADLGSKLPGLIGRLAATLHLATKESIAPTIADATLAGAIEIGDYHIKHAKALFCEAGADPRSRDASQVLAWIRDRSAKEFTTQEIVRSKDWGPPRVREALEYLESLHWVRTVEPTHKPGRPPEKWEASPYVTT